LSDIKLSTEQTARIVELTQTYFKDKLDSDIGRFEAEFLIDFFASEIGVFYYNKAISDANALLLTQVDTLSESLSELEKWTPAHR